MRRLPVYLVLDRSGSMNGDPIEAVKSGLRQMKLDLQNDPQAIESVAVSVITFAADVRQDVPLCDVANFQEPSIDAGGGTHLGEALRFLVECIDREVVKSSPTVKGDYKPLVFLMTDGNPTDEWEAAAKELRDKRPGNIIACAAGSGADVHMLQRITETVVKLADVTPGTLGAFMRWVTASVSAAGAGAPQPQLPTGVQIVP